MSLAGVCFANHQPPTTVALTRVRRRPYCGERSLQPLRSVLNLHGSSHANTACAIRLSRYGNLELCAF